MNTKYYFIILDFLSWICLFYINWHIYSQRQASWNVPPGQWMRVVCLSCKITDSKHVFIYSLINLEIWPLSVKCSKFSPLLGTRDHQIVRVGGLLGWVVVHCFQSRSKILHSNRSVTISNEWLQNLIGTYFF